MGTGRPVSTAAAPPSAGVILLAFGVLGSADRLDFFDTTGSGIAGLSGNGLPSLTSVTAGTLLVIGAVVGGDVASTLDMAVGALFILSGPSTSPCWRHPPTSRRSACPTSSSAS